MAPTRLKETREEVCGRGQSSVQFAAALISSDCRITNITGEETEMVTKIQSETYKTDELGPSPHEEELL